MSGSRGATARGQGRWLRVPTPSLSLPGTGWARTCEWTRLGPQSPKVHRGRERRGRLRSPAPSAICGCSSPQGACHGGRGLSLLAQGQVQPPAQQAKVTMGHFLTGCGHCWLSTRPPVTWASCRPQPLGVDASMVPVVQTRRHSERCRGWGLPLAPYNPPSSRGQPSAGPGIQAYAP